MSLTLDAYQIFMIAATSVGAFFGIAKIVLKQALAHMDEKLKCVPELKEDIKILTNTTNNTERDLLRIKADTAQQYVRRDDFIRLENHIIAKLDALGDRIDKLRERRINP